MKLYAETCQIVVLLYLCHIEHGKGTSNLGGGMRFGFSSDCTLRPRTLAALV